MRVLVVMGTRPEAIKLAPVFAALRRKKKLRVSVCATGQHRELLAQALRLFRLKPDFSFDVMTAGQTPDQTARRVTGRLTPLLRRLKPALVVVQGDTTTAAAGALAAAEAGVPVAHVEAGLRSFDLNDPFPEERNRVLIDSLSSLCFAPTEAARRNLLRSRLPGRVVLLTGNTIVDALRSVKAARGASSSSEALVTLHRREIHGAPFRRVCGALKDLVDAKPGLVLLFPLHPNPAVARDARRLLRHPRIRLVPPLSYPELLAALRRCRFVITDSGGLQEEAATLGKPVLIARAKTERPEVVDSGAGRLVGHDPRAILRWGGRLASDASLRRRMGRARNLYGDGRASERIAAAVEKWLLKSYHGPSA